MSSCSILICCSCLISVDPNALQDSNNLIDNVDDDTNSLQHSVDDVNESSSHLQISFYALVAWIIIVTVVLAVMAYVTYRRWRNRGAGSDGLESSGRSSIYSTVSGYLSGQAFNDFDADKDAVDDADFGDEPDSAVAVHIDDGPSGGGPSQCTSVNETSRS